MLSTAPEYLSRYNDWLQAGRSGNRNPVGARFFAHVQTGPGAHPASCTMGTGSFPGVTLLGRGADHPPPSSAEVKKEQSYTSNPLWAFRAVTGHLYLYILSTRVPTFHLRSSQRCWQRSLLGYNAVPVLRKAWTDMYFKTSYTQQLLYSHEHRIDITHDRYKNRIYVVWQKATSNLFHYHHTYIFLTTAGVTSVTSFWWLRSEGGKLV
jgi:hypothetical protein